MRVLAITSLSRVSCSLRLVSASSRSSSIGRVTLDVAPPKQELYHLQGYRPQGHHHSLRRMSSVDSLAGITVIDYLQVVAGIVLGSQSPQQGADDSEP